ncbi:MAG: hypothetical protein IJB70_03900 [Clostridia bacterium]|nr:hypothetical protein [Clostridia bacterium]
MKKLHEIDKNFVVDTNISEPDIVFYNVKENDFCLFGLLYDEKFRRMPEDAAKSVNEGTLIQHTNTAGGRIRFVTDSPYVAISVKLPMQQASPHMPLTGKAGFDLYENKRFRKMFVPPVDAKDGYDGICKFETAKKRLITINFPLYIDVDDVYIGLCEKASFEKAPEYECKKKVLFYGSSITQGACASRPGLAYTNLLSNRLDFDHINLGFSGSAFGELAMADYIASVNPDIFVMDYDNNAPTPEFLKETHEKFYKHYRAICPNTPIIMVTAPTTNFRCGINWYERRDIIKEIYDRAIASGDRNVYYVDGEEFWGDRWDSCSVDCLHPNDLGFMLMADRMEKTIKPLL